MKELNYKELMEVEGGGNVDVRTLVGINGNKNSVRSAAYTEVTSNWAAYAGQKTFAVSTERVQFGFSVGYGLAINR
ncbi:MAG: bacteriocin [Clostridiales bacterium]